MAATHRYRDDDGMDDLSEDNTSHDPSLLGNVSPPRKTRRLRVFALTVIMSVTAMLVLAASIGAAPELRLFESIICHDYYKVADPRWIDGNGFVEEKYCKVDKVQEQLALLLGWATFFDNLPGLFLAVPFGILVDRYGRKWILFMNVLVTWMRIVWSYTICSFPRTFPIRLVWLNGAWNILGGGQIVAVALFMVVITDVTEESQRATVFLCAQAILSGAPLVAAPLSSTLMERSPWIPLNIGVVLVSMGVLFGLALPETLQPAKSSSIGTSASHSTFSPPSTYTYSTRTKTAFRPRFAPLLSSCKSSFRSHFGDQRVLFLTATIIASTVGVTSSGIMRPYVSKRYSWSIAHTAYLDFFMAAVSIPVLLLGLPAASFWLQTRRGLSAFRKDLCLARISFALSTAGLVLIAFAASTGPFILSFFINTLGAGAVSLVRSLLATLVPPAKIARLFTVMSLLQGAAMLVAAPAIAGLYSAGLARGGAWIGLPFLVTGSIVGLATAGLHVLPMGNPPPPSSMNEHPNEPRYRDQEENASLIRL